VRIVRLPTGLDPDDLLKRDGPRAMEALLGDAKSLIATLWEHERDAIPLQTPEDKAGLKARLLTHVETIGDQEIKALYRRELFDRFSAFAYPARTKDSGDWRGRGGGGNAGGRGSGGGRGNGGGRWQQQQQLPTTPENANRLRRMTSGGGRDALCAAVVAGLLRWPDQIQRHANTMVRLIGLDPRFEAILDSHDSGEPLESQSLATILANQGMAPPAPADYADLRFGFLGSTAAPDQAAAALAQAIDLLVERPALEAALADATARYEREFTDEAYAEQQRLLKRKLEFDARLGQVANSQAVL